MASQTSDKTPFPAPYRITKPFFALLLTIHFHSRTQTNPTKMTTLTTSAFLILLASVSCQEPNWPSPNLANEVPRLPVWRTSFEDDQKHIDFTHLFEVMGEPRGSRGRELSELITRPRPKCNRRIRILNGVTRIRERGSLARFQCSHGFTLIGPMTLVCLRDRWSEEPPICVRNGCRPLRKPRNGDLRQSIGGAVAAFYCAPNTVLIGNPVIFCDGSRWNGTEPICHLESTTISAVEEDKSDENWVSNIESETTSSSPNIESETEGESYSTISTELPLFFSTSTLEPFNYDTQAYLEGEETTKLIETVDESLEQLVTSHTSLTPFPFTSPVTFPNAPEQVTTEISVSTSNRTEPTPPPTNQTKSIPLLTTRRFKIWTKRPRPTRPAKRPLRRKTTAKPRLPKRTKAPTTPPPKTQLPIINPDYEVAIDKEFLPREHVPPIRPIKPDMLNINISRFGENHAGSGSVIGALIFLFIGISFLAGVGLYCWRKNKGIARATQYDMDGRTLTHDANEDFMWVDQSQSSVL